MYPEAQVSEPARTLHPRIVWIQQQPTQLPELQQHSSTCKSSPLFFNFFIINHRQCHCDFHHYQHCYLVYHCYQTKDQNVGGSLLLASTAVQVIWSSRKPELVLGGVYNPWWATLEADVSAHALFYSPIPCKYKASMLLLPVPAFNLHPTHTHWKGLRSSILQGESGSSTSYSRWTWTDQDETVCSALSTLVTVEEGSSNLEQDKRTSLAP